MFQTKIICKLTLACPFLSGIGTCVHEALHDVYLYWYIIYGILYTSGISRNILPKHTYIFTPIFIDSMVVSQHHIKLCVWSFKDIELSYCSSFIDAYVSFLILQPFLWVHFVNFCSYSILSCLFISVYNIVFIHTLLWFFTWSLFVTLNVLELIL